MAKRLYSDMESGSSGASPPASPTRGGHWARLEEAAPLGIREGQATVTIPAIRDRQFIPEHDGYVRDRNTGKLQDKQKHKTPFHQIYAKLDAWSEDLLHQHPDFKFAWECAGASSQRMLDIFERDQFKGDILAKLQAHYDEKIKELAQGKSLSEYLAERKALQEILEKEEQRDIIYTRFLVDKAGHWLDNRKLRFWLQLMPQGVADQYHGLLWPFWMRWQYRFMRDKIFYTSRDSPVDEEARAGILAIMAVDKILLPRLGVLDQDDWLALMGDSVDEVMDFLRPPPPLPAPAAWTMGEPEEIRDAFRQYIVFRDVTAHRTNSLRIWLDEEIYYYLREGMTALPGFSNDMLPANFRPVRIEISEHDLQADNNDFSNALFDIMAVRDAVKTAGNLFKEKLTEYYSDIPTTHARWINYRTWLDNLNQFPVPTFTAATQDSQTKFVRAFFGDPDIAGADDETLFCYFQAPSLKEYEQACESLEMFASPVLANVLMDLTVGLDSASPLRPLLDFHRAMPHLVGKRNDLTEAGVKDRLDTYRVNFRDSIRQDELSLGDWLDFVRFNRSILESGIHAENTYNHATLFENNLPTVGNDFLRALFDAGATTRFKISAWDDAVGNALVTTKEVDPQTRSGATGTNLKIIPRFVLPALVEGGISKAFLRHIQSYTNFFIAHSKKSGRGISWPLTWRRGLTSDEEHVVQEVTARPAPYDEHPIAELFYPEGGGNLLQEFFAHWTQQPPFEMLQAEWTGLIALPLALHHILLAIKDDYMKERSKAMQGYRETLSLLGTAIERKQKQQTDLEIKNAQMPAPITYIQDNFMPNPTWHDLPAISGKMRFTPFFNRALGKLRDFVQITLRMPDFTLDMLTNLEDKDLAVVARASAGFIAACGARLNIEFPNRYKSGNDFLSERMQMGAAMQTLKEALLWYRSRGSGFGIATTTVGWAF